MSMKIKVPANYYSKETTETIKEYTTHKLDGDDYGRGQLEAAEATTTNATDALGRLMETLAQKGLLSAPEITYIVEGKTSRDATFTEE